MKKHFQGFLASLLFSALGIFSAGAQNVSKTLQLDSTVVRASDGSEMVTYSTRPLEYGIKKSSSKKEFESFSAKKSIEPARVIKQAVSAAPIKAAQRAAADLSAYSVGEIPLLEGVTPTGGKTYQIPIATAGGLKLTPSISVCYNSQAGDGVVGYGWSIAGYSTITLINKNTYYHNVNEGANTSNKDAAFALDGMPLVKNTQTETQSAYPLITVSGNILVCPNKSSNGYVYSFNVRYPDGATAVFGSGASNASSNKVRYPIAQMMDREGNKITYEYTSDGGRLDAVRYDYVSSGQYKGEIIFYYRSKYDQHSQYFAGEQMAVNYELTAINSKYNGEMVSRYVFYYISGEGVMKLLSSVECQNADGQNLPPLHFEYDVTEHPQDPWATAWLERRYSRMLNWTISPSEAENLNFKRGRFVLGGGSDGILIYPKGETYGVTNKKRSSIFSAWQYEFGSNYPKDQKIIYMTNLGTVSQVYSNDIVAGEGFQTMEAVDIDGDGQDELVKVNFNGTNGTNTRLLFTVSEINQMGIITQTSQFTVEVKGVIQNSFFTSPYRREYFWGDFLGNGKVQLLTIACDKNYNNTKVFDQESYAALIDLSTHVKLCDAKLFNFAPDNRVHTLDLDNDSQMELCFATSSGLDVYRFRNSSFVKEKTVSGITSTVFGSASSRPFFITDVNGDGYVDVMVAPASTGSTWNRYAFDGTRFVSSSVNICRNESGSEFMFCDINQDGCSDLLVIKESTSSLDIYKNYCDGVTWTSTYHYPETISNTKGMIPANVTNPLGQSAFMMVDGMWVYEFQCPSSLPRRNQLTRSTDSFGRMTVNTYAYLPEKIDHASSNNWWDSSLSVNNANGYAFKTFPMYVLEKEDSYISENKSSANQYQSRRFEYCNSAVHNQGLGFCGFSLIRSVDLLRNIYVDEFHDPQKRGVVTSVKTRLNSTSATPFSTVTNTYDNNSTTYGKLNPRLTKSVESSTLTGITTTTTYTYGSYDLPTKIVTSRRIGTGTAQTETVSRTYQNTATASKYVLGLVTEETLVKESDGDDTRAWSERTVNTYDSNSRLTNSKLYVGMIDNIRPIPRSGVSNLGNLGEAPAIGKTAKAAAGDLVDLGESLILQANNLVSETRWQYDSFGNVTSKKTASYGATTFLSKTYTFDSDGRYMLTETDALGHTTTYSGYNKFGKPTTVKDYRNRTTTYVYNAWGAVSKTTYTDGTVAQSMPAWGGSGLYTVTTSVTGKPQTIVHYDALGREVRTGQKRFDGKWQYVDKVYDSKGRLQKVSLPFRGSSASYWNTYAYDAYDRPTSITEASGKVSTWSYDGASTTAVKEGISSTSTTDASGNVVRVVDAGGTIIYTLRDDGQPASITAPGNVRTSFEYDDYGRKTKIVDPSAGTQTDSYVWNSNGSSVQTHINPNGTIKTYSDKYGRVTKIERPGEYTTTYTYNSYGLLTKEQSTNGTSKEYTYDAKDRVSTMKETVPDGKWLKKTYTYASGSALSKIAYEAQSGTITTETYTYANGHNTKITLADGTVVMNLTAENDLGLPTSVTTGSITREYGYTAFGMPTYRRMAGGALQDMRYQFDPATGNLTMRRDETRDKTENFTYDNLNRLTKIGARQITYDTKGNILRIGGVGTMTYDSSAHPYQITSLTTASSSVVANRAQSVSYTCYSRPSTLTEGSRSVAFTYNGNGDRVKMYEASGSTQVLTRYYISDRYEFDQTSSGTKERLYLGGDAYSAPMVYQREGSGSWTAYNIGRDYLGNITHIATASGTLVAEYSYDPWGRLRNPATLGIYSISNEPALFLGRGFTGHEHLPWFRLINMNARLYDPTLGRFLSPDPYVQAPDFTQNFNRYSYALNNPLKFTDATGYFWNYIIGALIGGVMNVISNWSDIQAQGGVSWLGYFLVGAAVGALSGGLGACTAGALQAGGVWAGALIGGLTGAATSSVSAIGNNLVAGRDWNEGLGKAALMGALSGAVTGGIKGYKFAKEHNANPWTNEVKGTEETYERGVKTGIEGLGQDSDKYCYAKACEYADQGHGNHTYEAFLEANGHAEGADISALKTLSGAQFDDGGTMSRMSNNVKEVCKALVSDPSKEILATVSLDGKNHWVNVYKITTATKLSWFGGKNIAGAITSIGYWDPNTAATATASSILDYKIYKF